MVEKISFDGYDFFSLPDLLGGIKKIIFSFSGVLSSDNWTEIDYIVPNGVVLLKGQLNIFSANRIALGC